MTFKYELGVRVKDLVTSFVGVITSRSEFLNGCIRYGVQPTTLNKDGAPHEAHFFDEQQLETVPKEGVSVPKSNTGGPRQDVSRAPDVMR
jgi:hypothetical protein